MGEARSAGVQGTEARVARSTPERPAAGPGPSMGAVLRPGNLKKALARSRRNRGAPGVDGMTVGDLGAQLRSHRPGIRSRLLDGTYEPQPVRRVEIPKASGGVRPIGVPTVLDCRIQQAVTQVLQGDWDGSSSDASFGFQPGRHSDEGNIQVRPRRTGQRVMASVSRLFDRWLKLTFKADKCAMRRRAANSS